MKFRVMMKNPDAVEYAIEDAVQSALFAFEGTEEEQEDKAAELQEELKDFLWKWIEYGEYLAVEFDTEANTAKVLKVNE